MFQVIAQTERERNLKTSNEELQYTSWFFLFVGFQASVAHLRFTHFF